MTTLTPDEIKALKPGDKVRLDGLVLTRSTYSWWRSGNNHTVEQSFLTLPGVTVTMLEDPDLLLARECAAKAYDAYKAEFFFEFGTEARKGTRDDDFAVQSALLAIKAVRGEKP